LIETNALPLSQRATMRRKNPILSHHQPSLLLLQKTTIATSTHGLTMSYRYQASRAIIIIITSYQPLNSRYCTILYIAVALLAARRLQAINDRVQLAHQSPTNRKRRRYINYLLTYLPRRPHSAEASGHCQMNYFCLIYR